MEALYAIKLSSNLYARIDVFDGMAQCCAGPLKFADLFEKQEEALDTANCINEGEVDISSEEKAVSIVKVYLSAPISEQKI